MHVHTHSWGQFRVTPINLTCMFVMFGWWEEAGVPTHTRGKHANSWESDREPSFRDAFANYIDNICFTVTLYKSKPLLKEWFSFSFQTGHLGLN